MIVNEADCMTVNARDVWLDALEALPPQTVIVFTTNSAGKLPARLRDRCEGFAFESGLLSLQPALQELANRIWTAEVGGDCPDVSHFGPLIDEHGDASFRRLIQLMTPYIRSKQPPTPTAPIATNHTAEAPRIIPMRSQAALKAWATRRQRKAMAQ